MDSSKLTFIYKKMQIRLNTLREGGIYGMFQEKIDMPRPES